MAIVVAAGFAPYTHTGGAIGPKEGVDANSAGRFSLRFWREKKEENCVVEANYHAKPQRYTPAFAENPFQLG